MFRDCIGRDGVFRRVLFRIHIKLFCWFSAYAELVVWYGHELILCVVSSINTYRVASLSFVLLIFTKQKQGRKKYFDGAQRGVRKKFGRCLAYKEILKLNI